MGLKRDKKQDYAKALNGELKATTRKKRDHGIFTGSEGVFL